ARRTVARPDRRANDQWRAVHGGDARPGPVDPHRRGDAGEQLSVVADLLRRAVGHSEVLARLRRHPVPPGAARLRRPRPPLRRIEAMTMKRKTTEHTEKRRKKRIAFFRRL